MSEFEINDVREEKDFKGISFSEFKKSDVKKELINSFIKNKLEPACYWSAELICAGHFADLWDTIILFYSKHIHLGNPKIAIYLVLRIEQFKETLNNLHINNELRMRNNDKIRRMFCEIICVLVHAKRRHSFDDIKIKKGDFDMVNLTELLKAPNVEFANTVFLNDDPKELFISINEFMFHLSNKNQLDACYWIEWILEFEHICKLKKEKLLCETRKDIPVDEKYQKDIVWILWNGLLYESEKKSKMIQKIMNSLLKLFTLKYSPTSFRKKKYIMYFAISLLTENILYDDEIIKDKEKLIYFTSKINSIYEQIKKNEHSPDTHYLTVNDKKKNLDKTIEKIEKMNNFSEIFIPRI
jgi:hypothetical protein